MNKNIKVSIVSGVVSMFALTSFASALEVGATTSVGIQGGSVTAQASTTVSRGNSQNPEKNMERLASLKARSDKEIDARIASLNKVNAKIQAMTHVAATDKASFATNIQTQISALSALKTKIDADTDIATLRTDSKSVTESYRVYMLAIPKDEILATVDSRLAIIDSLASSSAALGAKIDAAQKAGKNVTVAQSLFADMNAKIADAKIQYNAAVALVVPLTPDNGDKTVLANNKAAVASARAKMKVALTDIQTAKQDAEKIRKEIFQTRVRVKATTTADLNQ